MLNGIFYFFLAITFSEGPQRSLPPVIKSVNFSIISIDLIAKLTMWKEANALPRGKPRGNLCLPRLPCGIPDWSGAFLRGSSGRWYWGNLRNLPAMPLGSLGRISSCPRGASACAARRTGYNDHNTIVCDARQAGLPAMPLYGFNEVS